MINDVKDLGYERLKANHQLGVQFDIGFAFITGIVVGGVAALMISVAIQVVGV